MNFKRLFVCSRRGCSPGRPRKRKFNNRKWRKFAANICVNPEEQPHKYAKDIDNPDNTSRSESDTVEIISAEHEVC